MGLGGLFTFKTPRQYIEGFTDPLISVLNETPVYMGGDQTVSPFLSLDAPTTHPANNPISFMTGADNYALTRTMGLWLNEPNIRVAGKDYATLNTVVDVNFNPWSG
jgi:hypothetical protein